MFSGFYNHALMTCTALMSHFKFLTFEVDRYYDADKLGAWARITLSFRKHHEGHIQLFINSDGYEVWCDVINPWTESGDYNDVIKNKDNLCEYLFHLLSLLQEA